MTGRIDTDEARAHAGSQAGLPFEDEARDSGPRLRPAELARLLGISRQSVHAWIVAGKIRLGADGRIDPRRAVADVLRTSDPAKLRARVLAPFAEEVSRLRERVADLVHRLRRCEEDREFHEGAADELAVQVNRLERLARTLPGISDEARAALVAELALESRPAAADSPAHGSPGLACAPAEVGGVIEVGDASKHTLWGRSS
ncbi:MAG: hypothetical protein JNM79_03960 [Burkholderiales bacterium]|nr:hypothetical protein [Burkholderiales bacterium]